MSVLSGRRAVVTGASWGIGRAIAVQLAREGCTVVATARRRTWLEETVKDVKKAGQEGYVAVADLAKHDDITRLAGFVQQQVGGLDFLINVAFGDLEDPLEECDDDELAHFIRVSVTGTMVLTRHLLPLFPENAGHIVNIVADWGLPMHNIMTDAMTPYISAKHAISGFTQILRRELGLRSKPNLKVTGIYPGATASVDSETETSYHVDDPIEKSGDLISLKDIARSVAFVLSLEHSTITHLVISPPSNLYNGLSEW